MKIFLIVSAVVLLPAALIVLLLILPVKLIAGYENKEWILELRYLIFKISDLTEEDETPDLKALARRIGRRRKARKKPKKTATKKKRAGNAAPPTAQETVEALVSLLRDVVLPILKNKKFRIVLKKLKIETAGEDAAQAAVRYGAAVGACNLLIGFLYENFSLKTGKRKDLYVIPRYDRTQSEAEVLVVFKMSLFHALTTVLPELSKHVEL